MKIDGRRRGKGKRQKERWKGEGEEGRKGEDGGRMGERREGGRKKRERNKRWEWRAKDPISSHQISHSVKSDSL